jgi:hypothetical protein
MVGNAEAERVFSMQNHKNTTAEPTDHRSVRLKYHENINIAHFKLQRKDF